ncbi:hypothetical protein [Polaromonas sp. SM01]|uniref:hypothetical protein n=1 Tax=Polaromonas sp. SM01 TaxID=3085630 RepID=UPI002982343F|nr:hypothetical protein [Polaromonas sp. SM01]MDW5442462.1 hypothetical protein [Polaromonas sp. SM01]
MRHFVVTATMVLGLCAPAMARAGAATGALSVNISLTGNTSICTSQTLGQATNAFVQIVCGTGQFVSIEANPAKPFLGVHGGAYRYSFGPGLPWPTDGGAGISPYIGAGTVTSMKILNINGWMEPIELLVSF